MSRIYEALQRAEAERRGEETPDRAEAPALQPVPQPVPQSVLQPISFQREPEPFAPVAPPPAPVTYETVTPIAPAARGLSTDRLIESIPRTCWAASAEHLPSLEQRGSSLEQFRSLRSRIREFRSTSKLKSLLVTSALPQEGKSFVATNLAVTLALNKNSRVLLIDGDMRRSTIQEYFGCDSHLGLADYLAGHADLLQVMQRPSPDSTPTALLAPLLHNLVLLPAGNGGDKAGDLAGSSRFEDLLTQMSPHFEWIVIDSSPVVPIADATTLARACDAVLMVARAGVTTFTMAQRAQRELRASNLIGVVLNAVDKPPVLDGYYGYVGINE